METSGILVFIGLVCLQIQLISASDCQSTGHACVRNCTHHRDGDYQSCKSCHEFVKCSNNEMFVMPCPAKLEWDDHAKRCVAKSSTCKMCDDETSELELRTMDEPVVRLDARMEQVRVEHTPKRKRCKSTGPRCVSDCTGKKDGDYQSCRGCDVYVSCVAGLRYDDRPCAPGGLVWDDNKKRCEWNSTTCDGCAYPKPCHGTGPCCVSSCKGLPDGNYQSCLGCGVFASCSNQRLYNKRPCAPSGTVWDDNRKVCAWYSNTCHRCP